MDLAMRLGFSSCEIGICQSARRMTLDYDVTGPLESLGILWISPIESKRAD